ncbi:MAG: omptin family outer membrane protease [Candidatus Zixiibacteriota bacterium]|nr:MAG: omptin family outer membrane protease [candidate division Zixibacteria bacterium]
MKKQVLTAAVSLAVMVSTSPAQSPLKLSVAPSLSTHRGETEYIMDIRQTLTDESGNIIYDPTGSPVVWRLKSQLEFPLDVTVFGVTARVDLTSNPGFFWVEGSYFLSLNDPSGALTDSDWEGLSGYVDFTKFSYTESEATMESRAFDIEAGVRLLTPGKVSVAAVAGYRYQKIQQDVIGFDGWFRVFDTVALAFSDEQYSQSGTGKVGYYEITYKQPQVGLVTWIDWRPGLSTRIKTVYTPVWFEDYDDHVLRFKEAIADGDGSGFIGSARIHYELTQAPMPAVPFVDFTAEFVTLSASGKQTQSWYDDDPASPDFDETGLSIPGLPHEVNSTQFDFGLRIGVTF